jgi:hypothetical protein
VHVTVLAGRIEVRAEYRDFVPLHLCPREPERVHLRSSLMARQKIMNCVENVH